jgi:DNA excision repair protein ERCC-4
MGLPGVGPKLAWRLLFHFGNVSGVFLAGIDDLTKIDGIGNVLANQIREVLDVRINTALSS